MTVVGIQIGDQLLINDSSIDTIDSNADLELVAASGTVSIESLNINGSTISNSENTDLTITALGEGHVKFAGTNGLAIPSGTIAERPVSPEVGTVRYNTELPNIEIYDGSTFVPAAGTNTPISAEEFKDLVELYSLILG